jgi:3-dehydroquinate dehydratase-2
MHRGLRREEARLALSNNQAAQLALRGENSRQWVITVIDGPNMNQLGRRDPGLYGAIRSLDDLANSVKAFGEVLGVEIKHFHSNHEGALLDYIHENADSTDGFVVNPAGHTTYGEAMRDALKDSGRPWVETHFANLSRWYADISPRVPMESVFAHAATGSVSGFRQYSYHAAVLALVLSLDDATFLGRDTT